MAGGEEESEEEAGDKDANFEDGDAVVVGDGHAGCNREYRQF